MKTMLVVLIAIGLALAGAAQEKIPVQVEKVDVVPAQFIGVPYAEQSTNPANEMDLLKQYLLENIIYPEKAADCGAQGVEVAKFTVDEQGRVGNIEIVNSVCREVDKEFIRVLNTTSGKWKPALKGGENSICYPEVSLTFTLMNSPEATAKYFLETATKNYLDGTEKMMVDHKFKKAERYFDKAITYLPSDGALLYLRGICRYERGNVEGAMKDWERFTAVTGLKTPPQEIVLNKEQFKGVEAFANLYND